ncbi:hypothetical protein [Aquitalea pelogenes]|uniref:hypothetical protein n=1 Tax=Aquitalea pelogenes TaxID=1293573 RepID=UPI0035B37744
MKTEMNAKLIGFVYSILVRCVLKDEEIKKCESNEFRPGDFCDDNMLLAEAFVWLGYAESIDDLATEDDDVNKAWNDGFDYAESNQYFPWKFSHTEVDEILDITFLNKGDGFRINEWQEIYLMNVSDVWNGFLTRIE